MRTNALLLATILTTLAALLPACDVEPTAMRTVCDPPPRQHAECAPTQPSACGDGHCVAYVGPQFQWVCEMVEPGQAAGAPCARHEECDSGVCVLASINPEADPDAEYGACGQLCDTPADCSPGAICQPVGDGQASVCVVA